MNPDHTITLLYESNFDDSIGRRDKCKKFVKNLLNPSEKQAKEGESLKDQQQADEVKKV